MRQPQVGSATTLASNTGMHSPQDNSAAHTEDRLVNLEIKASYTEDLLDNLNEVVVRQQKQIDLLTRELARLAQQSQSADGPAPHSPRDELPPHY